MRLPTPLARREELKIAERADALIEEFGLKGVADRPAGALSVRSPQAGRACPRARQGAQAAAAGRTGRRPQPLGGRRAGRRDPRHPRPARRRGAPGRASHESGHAGQRPGGRARLRPGDRQRPARRGQGQSRGGARLSRERRLSAPILEAQGPRSLVRPGAGAARGRFRGRGRRRHGGAGRQRRRQDHDPAGAERPHPPHGRHPLPRPPDRRAGDGGRRPSRRRACARRTRHVHRSHGRGEPAPRRLCARATGKASAADFDRVFGFFPRLAERRRQQAGTLVGRRAADAGDRARASDAARAS